MFSESTSGHARALGWAAVCLFAAQPFSPCLAKAYPTKPVRLLVPVPVGTTPDVVARAVAQGLSQRLGQPIVVDNRAGGSGTVGMEAGAKATPDG
jgi:tripartite-type tricarboxylate transporter receptor subunit TctC